MNFHLRKIFCGYWRNNEFPTGNDLIYCLNIINYSYFFFKQLFLFDKYNCITCCEKELSIELKV